MHKKKNERTVHSSAAEYLTYVDKSPYLKEHPKKMDDNGYWYNE